MPKVKIITDSNSGILQSEASGLGIFIIPMPFTINGEEYLEDISITQQKFYEFLSQDANVTTSQPSQYYLQETFDELLKTNDELVYIPMSSGLSGTCANASKLAESYCGKVQVVDNLSISVIQKSSVLYAIELAKQGKSAAEIKSKLESMRGMSNIYISVATLKYLKKGGRVTPATAAIGSLLKIKPILSSNGSNFEKLGLIINLTQAKKKIIQQIKQDLLTKYSELYKENRVFIGVAHTNCEAEALKFKEELISEFPNIKFTHVDPLSLSVSCHIGPDALAAAVFSI